MTNNVDLVAQCMHACMLRYAPCCRYGGIL